MLNRSQKDKIIAEIKSDIEASEAMFLTNLIGIPSNDAVSIRKQIREKGGKVVVTRNTLFRLAAKGTKSEKMLSNLKGTNALAFAFEDSAAVAKVLKDVGADLPEVGLKCGFLGDQELDSKAVVELASLPSREEMLGTLLATFMAPVSAFARVLHKVHEQKASESTPAEA
jgi:large subunit ribosomal protein L10